jgi:hypothetical protein
LWLIEYGKVGPEIDKEFCYKNKSNKIEAGKHFSFAVISSIPAL